MKGKLVTFVVSLGITLLSGGSLLAHHGSGVSYDMSKRITLKGTVTEFVWRNPHCQTYMDIKDDKGNVTSWAFEMNSPGVLSKRGWNWHTLKPGDEVTITGAPSKVGGTPVAIAGKMVLADGRVLYGQIDLPREPGGPAE
jgi:hypothetical protein